MMPTPPLPVSPSVVEVELASRTPRRGIGDPAIYVGFFPARAVDADPDLGRERALGDLAVDGGSGQVSPAENGFQANDKSPLPSPMTEAPMWTAANESCPI